jgi:hypothetical protein
MQCVVLTHRLLMLQWHLCACCQADPTHAEDLPLFLYHKAYLRPGAAPPPAEPQDALPLAEVTGVGSSSTGEQSRAAWPAAQQRSKQKHHAAASAPAAQRSSSSDQDSTLSSCEAHVAKMPVSHAGCCLVSFHSISGNSQHSSVLCAVSALLKHAACRMT